VGLWFLGIVQDCSFWWVLLGLQMMCAVSAVIDIIDAAECRAFLVRGLHADGGRCPDCGVQLDGRQADTFAAGGRVCCNSCGRWFTWRTSTVFHRAPLDDRQIFLLLMLTELHCSLDGISSTCRLSLDDAYLWQRRISEVFDVR
jgi:hypothetical protein